MCPYVCPYSTPYGVVYAVDRGREQCGVSSKQARKRGNKHGLADPFGSSSDRRGVVGAWQSHV